MNDCIFCKLSKGEIPSNTVYEDDNFRVILDAAPANVGHCLVIPKKHALNIIELDSDTVAEAHRLAKRVAEAIMSAYSADGVNILQNNGVAAGQTVNHYHIHVIPRFDNDGMTITADTIELGDNEYKVIAKKLSEYM